MTKQELIARVYETELSRRETLRRRSDRNGTGELTKKAVAELVDTVFSQLGDYFIKAKLGANKNGSRHQTAKFTYPGFGTFTKRRRPGRPGAIPRPASSSHSADHHRQLRARRDLRPRSTRTQFRVPKVRRASA